MSSCASAWVVRTDENGGVVGYKSGAWASQSTIDEKVRSAVRCPNNYRVVSDELRSNQFTYTTYETVNTVGRGTASNMYGGRVNYQSQYSSSVPVQNVGTEYWREMTYICE